MFSAAPLQRGDELREDLDWLRRCWQQGHVLVIDAHGDAFADGEGRLQVLPTSMFPEECLARAILLGTQGDAAADAYPPVPGESWFALAGGESALPAGVAGRWVGLRRAGLEWPAHHSSLFAHARALVLWQARARHCGSCGAVNAPARAGHSLRCGDPACASETFPRLDPAVIVLVTDGSRCLLGRQASWPTGQYSTLAGFVEPGESLEDAVRREVAEEAGVRVGACRYRGSQPWPFPSSLMIGFRAEAIDPAIRLGDELEDARWFELDHLLGEIDAGRLRASSPLSIAFRLLHEWVDERAGADAAARLHGPA